MAKKTIDVQLLNPFITATLECLTQMAGMTPERKRVFVKNDPMMHGYITGIIGMSNGITGSCSVSFPQTLAKHIVAKFMGESESNLTEEMVSDGVGEVLLAAGGGGGAGLSCGLCRCLAARSAFAAGHDTGARGQAQEGYWREGN